MPINGHTITFKMVDEAIAIDPKVWVMLHNIHEEEELIECERFSRRSISI